MYLYVAASESAGLAKIGVSKAPEGRLLQLRSVSGLKDLRLVAWKRGGRKAEREALTAFRQLCVMGEWVQWVPPVQSFAKTWSIPRDIHNFPSLTDAGLRAVMRMDPKLRIAGTKRGPKPLARKSRRYGESYPAELADELEAAAAAAGQTVPAWIRGAVMDALAVARCRAAARRPANVVDPGRIR